MYEFSNIEHDGAVIKVFGVGGCGGNAINHMLDHDVQGIEFIGLNTDAQALADVKSALRFQLGRDITRGLGAGANPELGRKAALEDKGILTELLADANMLFITAGMGGGTGTGASPVIADIAKEMGILTVAVVTRPFPFEGKKRISAAEKGIEALKDKVDSLIIIPNEKLMSVLGKNTSLVDAFHAANDVLLNAIKGIADLITCPGMINVDFADLRAVMENQGVAILGASSSRSQGRAKEATEKAIRSPLMEDLDLEGAQSILVNITAGIDLTLGEFTEVGDTVEKFAADGAMIVVGTVIDTTMSDILHVTLIATGLGSTSKNIAQYRNDQNCTSFNSNVIPRNVPPIEEELIDPAAMLGVYQRSARNASATPTSDPNIRQSNESDAYLRGTSRDDPSGDVMSSQEHRFIKKRDYSYFDIPAFIRRHFKR